ncbi:hypothetical protein BGZ49_005972 [Haplosporangium sp. Z 27]|nr:hypothetical protein BGZ49_005972 [Haplosporangium sp. Z 27]
MHRPALLLTLATVALATSAHFDSEINGNRDLVNSLNPSKLSTRNLAEGLGNDKTSLLDTIPSKDGNILPAINHDLVNSLNPSKLSTRNLAEGLGNDKNSLLDTIPSKDGNFLPAVNHDLVNSLNPSKLSTLDHDLVNSLNPSKLSTRNLAEGLGDDKTSLLDILHSKDGSILPATIGNIQKRDYQISGPSSQDHSVIQKEGLGMMIPQNVEQSEKIQMRRRNNKARRSSDDDDGDEDDYSESDDATKDDTETSSSTSSSADKNNGKDLVEQKKQSSSAGRNSSTMMGLSVFGALVSTLLLCF